MSKDFKCPYCETWQDICHDDGFGYAEDELHQEECCGCGKTFVFTTSITYNYEAQKADCLNGGQHKYVASVTYPKSCTKMVCETCGDRRSPTVKEWKEIKNESINVI